MLLKLFSSQCAHPLFSFSSSLSPLQWHTPLNPGGGGGGGVVGHPLLMNGSKTFFTTYCPRKLVIFFFFWGGGASAHRSPPPPQDTTILSSHCISHPISLPSQAGLATYTLKMLDKFSWVIVGWLKKKKKNHNSGQLLPN